jgi:hypothetical protein
MDMAIVLIYNVERAREVHSHSIAEIFKIGLSLAQVYRVYYCRSAGLGLQDGTEPGPV